MVTCVFLSQVFDSKAENNLYGILEPMKDIVIVGAGLAGLTTAFRLSQRGYTVTVLEKSDVLGGRTSSWQEGDMEVESGLHKVLGIYRAMPQLLADIGVSLDDIVAWVDAVEFHSPHDVPRSGYFTAAPFSRPFRTLHDAFTSNYVSWPERLRLVRMAMHGLYDAMRYPEQLDAVSIAAYARRFKVGEQTIRKILQPLTQGVFFLPPEEYSAYATFSPVLAGLKNGGTFRVGAFRDGMSDVLIQPLVRAIEQRGGEVRTNSLVMSLDVDDGIVRGVTTSAAHYAADHVVIATPLRTAQQLLQQQFSHRTWVQTLLKLKTVSTISVQFDLESPVFTTDHTHFSTGSLACFAEQVHTTFTHRKGRLSSILYPADDLLSLSDTKLIEIATQAAHSLGIKLDGIRHTAVVRHPHEFYATRPGAEALRPAGPTPEPGLTLAGDYIKQPFLASMEGAIISGNRAARIVQGSLR